MPESNATQFACPFDYHNPSVIDREMDSSLTLKLRLDVRHRNFINIKSTNTFFKTAFPSF